MSDALAQAQALEALLTQLYVDAGARAAFLRDPVGTALARGVSPADAEALLSIDRPGLELAALSFEKKRAAQRPGRARVSGARAWLVHWASRLLRRG